MYRTNPGKNESTEIQKLETIFSNRKNEIDLALNRFKRQFFLLIKKLVKKEVSSIHVNFKPHWYNFGFETSGEEKTYIQNELNIFQDSLGEYSVHFGFKVNRYPISGTSVVIEYNSEKELKRIEEVNKKVKTWEEKQLGKMVHTRHGSYIAGLKGISYKTF